MIFKWEKCSIDANLGQTCDPSGMLKHPCFSGQSQWLRDIYLPCTSLILISLVKSKLIRYENLPIFCT